MSRLYTRASSEYSEVSSPVVSGYPVTFACFARLASVTVEQVLMSVADSSSGTDYLTLTAEGNQAGDPVLARARNNNARARTTTGYPLNQWFHAAAVHAAAGDHRAFIFGGNRGDSATVSNDTNFDTTTIGRVGDVSPGDHTDGFIAIPAAWNVALTDREIFLLAQGVPPVFIRPQNLIYWPLEKGNDFEWRRRFDLTSFNTPGIGFDPPRVMEYRSRVRMRAVTTQGTTPLVSWSIPNVWTPRGAVLFPSVAVTPAAVTAVAVTVDPTVVLGSLAIAPAVTTAVGVVVDPAVELGSVTVAPAAIDAVATTVDPTVELGSLTIAPAVVTAVGVTVDPDVVLGGVTVAPDSVTVVAATVDPDVGLSSMTVTPTVVAGVGTVVAPTVELGSVSIAPDPVTAVSTTIAPIVELGSISFTPTEVAAVGTVVAPGVELGSISVTPATVDAIVTTVDPTVLAPVDVTPAPAAGVADTVDPVVVFGSVAVSPAALSAVGAVIDPDVVLGSIVLTPDNAWVVTTTVDPTVIAPVGIVVTLPERTATLSLAARDTTVTAPGRVGAVSVGERDTTVNAPERSASVRIKGQ